MMDVAVHAYIVKEFNIANVTMNNTSVYFLLENCFRTILYSINDSTDAILKESKTISD